MNEAKVGIVNTHLVAIPGFSKGLLGVWEKNKKTCFVFVVQFLFSDPALANSEPSSSLSASYLSCSLLGRLSAAFHL